MSFNLHAFKRSSWGCGISTLEVDRPYRQVLADVHQLASTCVNGYTRRDTVLSGPFPTTSLVLHRARVVPMSTPSASGAPEGSLFVMQTPQPSPRAGEPPGGYFAFVAEISPIRSSRTRVSSHYLSFFKNFVGPLDNWAQGSKTECPKTSFR